MKALLDFRPRLNIKDNDGKTAEDLAKTENIKIYELLHKNVDDDNDEIGGFKSDLGTQKKYIKKNPFPSFSEMKLKLTQEFPEYLKNYSEIKHSYIKQLYEYFYNKTKVVEVGKNLNKIGGWNEMQYAYQLLRKCSPLAKSRKTDIIYSIPQEIEFSWDGIGDWKI